MAETDPIRALRAAMLFSLAPVAALLVLQVAIVALVWPSQAQVWSAVVVMLVAQSVALAGGLACVVAMIRMAGGTPPGKVIPGTAKLLRRLGTALLAALVITTVIWLLIDTAAATGALIFSLVSAQAWFAFRAAYRRIAVPA